MNLQVTVDERTYRAGTGACYTAEQGINEGYGDGNSSPEPCNVVTGERVSFVLV
jgi:hypothetical protein